MKLPTKSLPLSGTRVERRRLLLDACFSAQQFTNNWREKTTPPNVHISRHKYDDFNTLQFSFFT